MIVCNDSKWYFNHHLLLLISVIGLSTALITVLVLLLVVYLKLRRRKLIQQHIMTPFSSPVSSEQEETSFSSIIRTVSSTPVSPSVFSIEDNQTEDDEIVEYEVPPHTHDTRFQRNRLRLSAI